MRKLLISTLGTKKHIECRYSLGDWISDVVLYPQEALIKKLCVNWNKDDRIYILCTPEAQKNNWEGRKDFGEGLKARLEKMNLPFEVINLTIPDGKDAGDNDEIVRMIEDIIPDDGDVFIDLSHSTRLLPFLEAISLYCAMVAGNVRVAGIYYGPHDLIGTPDRIRQIPPEERIVPIMDITELWKALEFASSAFLAGRAGNPELLKQWLLTHGSENAHFRKLKDLLLGLCRTIQEIALMRYSPSQSSDETESFRESVLDETGLGCVYERIARALEVDLRNALLPDRFARSKWCLSRGMILQACLYARNEVVESLARSGLIPGRSSMDWDRFLLQVIRLPELDNFTLARPFGYDHIGLAGQFIKEGFKALILHHDRLMQSSPKKEFSRVWSEAVRNFGMRNIPYEYRKFLVENEKITRKLAQSYARLTILIDHMTQGKRFEQADPEEFSNICEKILSELEEAFYSFMEKVNP